MARALRGFTDSSWSHGSNRPRKRPEGKGSGQVTTNGPQIVVASPVTSAVLPGGAFPLRQMVKHGRDSRKRRTRRYLGKETCMRLRLTTLGVFLMAAWVVSA